MRKNIVLLGDSIFDNATYVPGEPCVTDQFRAIVGDRAGVSMLAVDGDYAEDVGRQLRKLPAGATHLFVSAGGNDALNHLYRLNSDYEHSRQLFEEWSQIQSDFRGRYQAMLRSVLARRLPTAVCTIYDAVPSVGQVETTALSLFNDVIVSEAVVNRVPVVDLRAICTDPLDYSPISPIEPSSRGGAKIAKALAYLFDNHDFITAQTIVYTEHS
jgi:hypothetical protein